MANKITPRQLEILKLMCDGWELGSTLGWRSSPARSRLQKGGVGHGGETRKVNASLVNNLIQANLIRNKNHFTGGKYVLTEYGVQVAKDNKFYQEHAWTKMPASKGENIQ